MKWNFNVLEHPFVFGFKKKCLGVLEVKKHVRSYSSVFDNFVKTNVVCGASL